MSIRTDIIRADITRLAKELEVAKKTGNAQNIKKLEIALQDAKLRLVRVKNEESIASQYMQKTYPSVKRKMW